MAFDGQEYWQVLPKISIISGLKQIFFVSQLSELNPKIVSTLTDKPVDRSEGESMEPATTPGQVRP